ncbi:MAG: nucleotidyltransferase family protein [Alphaproteobacteria bacterium]|nr:nucleotidyltransferase family protein [Alphaproteobacteria bacterium]
MKPSEILKAKRNAVLDIISRIGATNARVFGSVVRGEDKEGSDLDMLIEVPRGTTLLDLAGIEEDLRQELGIPVDLLTPGDLHPRLRDRVLSEARPV